MAGPFVSPHQTHVSGIHSFTRRCTVLEERVNHDIALSSERDEVDRKKRHAADTTHFLFDSIYSLEKTSYPRGVLFIREIALKKSERILAILHREEVSRTAHSIVGMNIIAPRRLVFDPVTCKIDFREESYASPQPNKVHLRGIGGRVSRPHHHIHRHQAGHGQV
jgi:hypothetical protein